MAQQASVPQQSYRTSLPQPTKETSKTKVNDFEEKTLEELVLSDLYYDIARNLPPDDVLTYMYQDDLITDGQRDQYKMMKASNQPEVERSEYLLECLRKGKPGFLRRLCTILRQIPPSSYIADKIEEKMRYTMQQQPVLKSPARTDRTKKSKDNTYWISEYKKMENKTRIQLRAKDREIKRLRKAIQQLERENNDNLQRLLSEMKNQVDNVSKWIDCKAETLPQSSALVNMALSQDVKVDDIFTGTSESSSNQSTLERPPKHHPRKKESAKGHSSTSESAADHEKSPANHQRGSSDSALKHFRENVSNPPTAIESDTSSDITRPLQVSELIGIGPELSELDNSNNCPTKTETNSERDSQPAVCGTASKPVYTCTGTVLPIGAHASVMYIQEDTIVSDSTTGMQPTRRPSTPSTIKSNAASPSLSLSPQGGSKSLKPTKIFKYGKEGSPSSDQEDFRVVFKRIRGREPPRK